MVYFLLKEEERDQKRPRVGGADWRKKSARARGENSRPREADRGERSWEKKICPAEADREPLSARQTVTVRFISNGIRVVRICRKRPDGRKLAFAYGKYIQHCGYR